LKHRLNAPKASPRDHSCVLRFRGRESIINRWTWKRYSSITSPQTNHAGQYDQNRYSKQQSKTRHDDSFCCLECPIH